MASKQTYLEVNEQSERLKIWVGQQRPNFEGKQALALPLPENQPDVLELSDGVKPAQPATDKEETAGIIKTQDGKQIDFSLQLSS
ncbi:MAG: hypothetical protein ACYC4E_00750 [Carboxydocellales bacterium]